jgi:hypothetical protein
MPAVQRSCDRLFREEAAEDRKNYTTSAHLVVTKWVPIVPIK